MKRLFGKIGQLFKCRRPARTAVKISRPLDVEALENRVVPTASLFMNGSTLTYWAPAGDRNDVTISTVYTPFLAFTRFEITDAQDKINLIALPGWSLSADGHTAYSPLFAGKSSLATDITVGNASLSGLDRVTLLNVMGPTSVHGTGSSDTLIGANNALTWNITASNAGNIVGYGTTVNFDHMANLTGGSASDVFQFSNAMNITGVLNGGGGSDKADYSQWSASHPVSVDLRSAVLNVETLVGGASLADTVQGQDQDNTWIIPFGNEGTVTNPTQSVAFFGFENLTGGSHKDTFQFWTIGGVSGKIDGGLGANSLDYSHYLLGAAKVDLTHFSVLTPSANYGFSNIESAIGSAAGDTLVGWNANNDWTLGSSNAGTVAYTLGGLPISFSFQSFENLTGGAYSDNFAFDGVFGGVTGKIDGGGGAGNTLNYQNWINPAIFSKDGVYVNLLLGTADRVAGGIVAASPGISTIQNVIGSANNDIIVGDTANNILQGGLGRDILIGGAGSDSLWGNVISPPLSPADSDDILIGGSTDYDHDYASLNNIRAEWTSSASYQTRINHLIDAAPGGLNGATYLTAQKVHDFSFDDLHGQAGQDWFFVSPGDSYDQQTNPPERVN